MVCDPLTPTNWIAIVAATIGAGSLVAAILSNARTLRQNNRFRRAEWLMNVTLQLHKEERLRNLFDAIQYDKFTFIPREGAGGDLGTAKELDLIYWLDFLNAVSDAVHEGLLTIRHLKSCTLGYALDKTMENPGIRAYLDHVGKYDVARKSYLVSWGILKNMHSSFLYLRHVGENYRRHERRGKRIG